MKLVSLPFHWVYPSAPAKYVGCRISIPVYDPASPERSEAIVRAARVISFNAAVGSVNGKKFRGPKLPKCVYLPTAHIRIIRKDFGNGSKVIGRQIRYLGFRRYKIKHIMTMPFAWCPSEAANLKTHVCLRRLTQSAQRSQRNAKTYTHCIGSAIYGLCGRYRDH